MGYWNYRVVKHVAPSGEVYHTIHEAYYNSKNQITAITKDQIYPCGESKAELRRDIDLMLKAFKKPTLVYDEIKYAKEDSNIEEDSDT